MPPSHTIEAPAAVAFVCDCGAWLRSACNGLPFFKKYEGRRYCVLHYPGKDKSAIFNEALQRKLEAEDFDFRGVWFPDEVNFNNRTFAKPVVFLSAMFSAGASFDYATFSAEAFFAHATFSARVTFASATFSAEASFASATFGAEASFAAATFGAEASFAAATFSAGAYFGSATFSAEAYFGSATFGAEAFFAAAIFKDYVRFVGTEKFQVFGDKSSLNLQFARIEKPERFSFHTLTLSPHWFVNVDARKFEFINVKWNWYGRNIRQKLERLRSRNAFPTYHLLEIACRNLALNAEENHLYARASSFRYLAMNVGRLGTWNGSAFWTLGWWYWLASGYGERAGRASFVLLGVLVLFAALYVGIGYPNWGTRVAAEKAAAETPHGEVTGWPQWSGALLYSLGVMTLQKPEPRPATDAAQAVVMLETILGPVQAALLALAIRRKFMR